MKAVPAGTSLVFPGVAMLGFPLQCYVDRELGGLGLPQAFRFEGLLCLTNHSLWSKLGL